MLLLSFGYGYVARRLAAAGDVPCIGTTRDGREGTLAYTHGEVTPPLQSALARASHILISTPPHDGEASLIEAIAPKASQCRWLGYLSTTGVYGDRDGGVVDERTPPMPNDAKAAARFEAERAWQQLGAHIFRLAGIYGPGRSAFDTIHEGRAQVITKPGQLFNRIHVDDIVQALQASMNAPTPGEIFNLADDAPAAQADAMRYAFTLLGRPAPRAIPYERATLSPAAQRFWASSRRVDASKIKKYHGISWLYPTYRHGLAAILQESRP